MTDDELIANFTLHDLEVIRDEQTPQSWERLTAMREDWRSAGHEMLILKWPNGVDAVLSHPLDSGKPAPERILAAYHRSTQLDILVNGEAEGHC